MTSSLRTLLTAALAFLFIAVGCKQAREPDSYQVVSYDATNHQWTIIHTETINGEQLKKRLIVQCLLYQKGKDDIRDWPSACELQVGRTFVPNLHPSGPDRTKYLHVEELGTGFFVVEGWGDDLVSQQFKIIKENLLNSH